MAGTHVWPWEESSNLSEVIRCLRPLPSDKERQRTVVGKVATALRESVELRESLGLAEIVSAGSHGRGTDIKNNLEVDLVVICNNFNVDAYDSMLENLAAFALENLDTESARQASLGLFLSTMELIYHVQSRQVQVVWMQELTGGCYEEKDVRALLDYAERQDQPVVADPVDATNNVAAILSVADWSGLAQEARLMIRHAASQQQLYSELMAPHGVRAPEVDQLNPCSALNELFQRLRMGTPIYDRELQPYVLPPFISTVRGQLPCQCIIEASSDERSVHAIHPYLVLPLRDNDLCNTLPLFPYLSLCFPFLHHTLCFASPLVRMAASDKRPFKKQHSLEKRKSEAERIREKYPDRIPVIVEKARRSKAPDIDKKKYLVPSDLSVSQFMTVIRRRIKLEAEQAIFLFVHNTIPPSAALMSSIYDDHKDEDGFLYIVYNGESTFG
ncbi:unnamed protein product [Closterium sp. Yama58-4]|nr:unnamed protein product [Closterium sp. Yama58-4]